MNGKWGDSHGGERTLYNGGMILAGIDEAGYGPLLGPLVVGCCAFETSAEGESLPCLWKRLRRVVSKTRDKTGKKIHVNDSKLVYSPAAGLKELERAILAIAATAGGMEENLAAFGRRVAGQGWEELAGYRWYGTFAGEAFPLEQEGVAVRMVGNALRAEMERCQTRCVHLAAQVLPEGKLNRLFEQTRNKSSVLFSAAAAHLDYLLRNFGDKGLVIFCDRQGGREHYGHLLRLMFEEWGLEVVGEGDGISEYRLTRGEHAVRLVFREKAETECMAVAVASMLCKYLREALMRRFNAYWQQLLPGLEPTAGYYTDGMRFLKDIEPKRKELGIGQGEMVRQR